MPGAALPEAAELPKPKAASKPVVVGEFPLDAGSIYFKMHRADADAEFIRCRMGVDKSKLVKHALQVWNLPAEPGVLLRLCGTPPASSRPGEQHVDFVVAMEGVLDAASTAGAWLFSTGLDFGMASAAGTSLGRLRHHCDCPLVGFTDWGVVQGSEQLLRDPSGGPAGHGAKRVYTDCRPDEDMSTVSLQANHSHFFLVGGEGDEGYTPPDPTKNKKQVLLEARKRSFTFAHEFEIAMATSDGEAERDDPIPRVLMVLCGDETTLAEVITYCKQQTKGAGHVVFATPTGGLAEAVTKYVYTGKVPSEWLPYAKQFAELKELNQKRGEVIEAGRRDSMSNFDKATSSLVFVEGAEGKFPMFSFALKRGALETATTLKDAIMLQIGSPRGKVCAAVAWDDGARLSQIFTTMVPAWLEDRADILREAAQLALQQERASCLKVLVSLAAPVKDLDLLALYDKLYDKEEPPRFPMYLGHPRPTVVRTEATEARARASPTANGSIKAGFRQKSREQLASRTGDAGAYASLDDPNEAVYEFYPREVWSTLEEVVPGLCLYWRTMLSKRDEEQGERDAEDLAAGGKVGARWIDIYVWAVLLGNAEVATMLLPACQEPMRAAVIGARIFDYMAVRLPLNAVELLEHAKTQEQWAIGLLDQCGTFGEARRMLVTKSNQWSRTVLHLAVQSGLRNFCAHHHCQTLCDEWQRGNTRMPGSGGATPVLRSRETPGLFGMVRILLFAACPCPMVWGHQLEWSLSEGLDPRNDLPPFDPPSSHFYSVPQVKSVLRLFFHLGFTTMMSYIAMNTVSSDQHESDIAVEFHHGGGLENRYVDIIVCVWTFSLIFDEWYKYIQDVATFQADFWNHYDYLTLTVTTSAIALRFIALPTSVEVLAFTVLLIWCRTFKYLTANRSIGLLVIMIMEMFKDIVLWALVSAIFLIAYTVAFVTISNPDEIDAGGDQPLTVTFWAMLGSFDNHEVGSWNPQVGQVMLWSYLVVSNIVLVNLLIAMMGDTYGVIKEKADEEWKFGRLRSVVEGTERMSPIPPPLNLPITLGLFLWLGLPDGCREALKGTWIEYMFNSSITAAQPEPAKLKIAQGQKRKVARRLLLSLKAQEERDENESVVGRLKQLRVEMQELEEALAEVKLTVGDKKGRSFTPSEVTAKVAPPLTSD